MADPLDTPQWKRMFAFCGQCWERRSLWVKGNVGYCLDCRPDWQPDTFVAECDEFGCHDNSGGST